MRNTWRSESLGGCDLRKVVLVLAVVMGLMLPAVPMFSQTATGRISGTVKDQSGGVIVGAAVVVTDVARGLTRNLTTDEAGAYLASNLIAGTYTVRTTFTGFQALERTNVILPVGGDLFIDVVLVPGAQTQTITVTEELPLVNVTSATLGGTLSNETISDLPLNGRNFTLLLELRPGVVLTLGNDSGGTGAASTNGLRPEQSNEYLVEGLHAMSPFNGQPIMNALALRGDAATVLPVDAIQEFNQQINGKAEYGWRAGGAINIGLKSGTNALHGTAYSFFRREELDARNFFNVDTQPQVNINLNQYGATLGGPIKRDKLFFFLGVEQQRLNVGDPVRSTTPFTDGSMVSNLASCTVAALGTPCTPVAGSIANGSTPNASNHFILACDGIREAGGTLSPQSLALVGLNANCSPGSTYPNATNGVSWFVPHGGSDHGMGPGLPDTSYFSNLQSEVVTTGGVAKADYALNDKNTVSGFFFLGNGDNIYSADKTNPIWRTNVLARSLLVAGTWTWLPNAAWANAFRVGYAYNKQRYIGDDEQQGLNVGLATGVPILDGARNFGYPQEFLLEGFTELGSRNTEIEGPETQIEFNDTVNYLVGNHNVRFGGAILSQNQNGGTWADTRGRFTFGREAQGSQVDSGLVGFLVGQNAIPSTVGTGLGFADVRQTSSGLEEAVLFYGNPESHMRRMAYSAFVQDDWRIHPRLTLNLGVRYESTGVIHDRDYILSSFNPALGQIQEGIHRPRLYNGDHNNFSPRVGFAWDVRGNGRTVIRAGGSIINELVIMRTFSEIGNDIGLAGNATTAIIGCTVTPGPLGAGDSDNCTGSGGTFITPGGTRDVASVEWSRGDGTIGALSWNGPILGTANAIYPSSGRVSCNSSIILRDAPGAPGRPGAPCAIVTVDPNLRTPYVTTWTLSVQHAITNNVSVDVAYVGNHGTKFISHSDDNQADPARGFWLFPSGPGTTYLSDCLANQDGDSCDGSTLEDDIFDNRPFATKFPHLGTITRLANRHWSNYRGLQMSVTMRRFRGLSLVSGYTYARALDVASSNGEDEWTDSYNVGLDYGRANSDLRHRLTFSPSYAFPGVMGYYGLLNGWRINGNFKYQTGRPWNPEVSGDFAGNGLETRWDFFGDASDFETDYTGQNIAIFHPANGTVGDENPQTGTPYAASDLATASSLCSSSARSSATLAAFGCWTQGGSAITPPPPGSFGTLTRGLLSGPTFWNLDMSLSKTQRLTERFSAEFRAEFFNVFNHPVFAQPEDGLGCEVGDCVLGQTFETPDVASTNPVLGSGGSRRIQLGVKIIF